MSCPNCETSPYTIARMAQEAIDGAEETAEILETEMAVHAETRAEVERLRAQVEKFPQERLREALTDMGIYRAEGRSLRAEVEQLRTELVYATEDRAALRRDLEAASRQPSQYYVVKVERDDARAEVDKLRGTVAQLETALDAYGEVTVELDKVQAERDRLRAVLAETPENVAELTEVISVILVKADLPPYEKRIAEAINAALRARAGMEPTPREVP